jgi:hypothetical protein
MRFLILSDASEDWCGLYELIWALTPRFHGASGEEVLRACMAEVLALVDSGLLKLAFSQKWTSSAFEPVAGAEALEVIRNPQSWRQPSETPIGCYYAVATTDVGDRAYHAYRPEDVHRFTSRGPA